MSNLQCIKKNYKFMKNRIVTQQKMADTVETMEPGGVNKIVSTTEIDRQIITNVDKQIDTNVVRQID